MKKNISITIGNTLFHIEESAYEELRRYLDAVRAKFAGYPEGEEIAGDIENRVAEHFLENRRVDRDKIVTEEEVRELVRSMGQPEDLAEDRPGSPEPEPAGAKKLYRNPDDAVIAGVASGLAAYLGIDPVIVRVLFVAFTLAQGFGIVAYLIFWVVMPEAKSATDKLRMKGSAVTLQAVDQMIKETAGEIKERARASGVLRKVAEGISAIFGFVFRRLIPVIGKVIGALLALLAVVGMFFLTFALALALFNIDSPYVDFPLAAAVQGPLLSAALVAGYVTFLIPLLFVLGFGWSLLRGWNPRRMRFALGLLGIWFIALIGLGVSASRIVPRYHEYLANDPEYRSVTRSLEVERFDRIVAENGISLSIQKGEDPTVVIEGRTADLDALSVANNGGTLTVLRTGRTRESRLCIFCFSRPVTVRITAPDLSELQVKNAVQAESAGFSPESFRVTAENGSRVSLEFATTTGELSATAQRASTIFLSGASERLVLAAENGSRIGANEFLTTHAEVTVRNASRAELGSSKFLSASAENGSWIEYGGNPEVHASARNASRIRSADGHAEWGPEEFQRMRSGP